MPGSGKPDLVSDMAAGPSGNLDGDARDLDRFGPYLDSSSGPHCGPTGGAYAAELLERHLKALVILQAGVLKDEDTEPIHQMRIRFRRVRSLLMQFGPALQLPERVTEQTLAKTGRRLGLVRDLDVLAAQLHQQLLPLLPDGEQAQLKPLLKSLRRSRKLAFVELVEALRSRRYLRMLAELQAWVRQPLLTALGQEPARDWLLEWKAPVLSGLLSHAGWRATNPDRDAVCLHDLRKRIKQARYGLANLKELEGERLDAWLDRFKSQQTILGDLNDLQVMEQAMAEDLGLVLPEALPELNLLLLERKRLLWQQWLGQASLMLGAQGRQALHGLLCEGSPGEARCCDG